MKIKVHSEEKESNGYAVEVGKKAYELWASTKNAQAHAGPYVAFRTEAEAAAHGKPFPCYFCTAVDGFAIYHSRV